MKNRKLYVLDTETETNVHLGRKASPFGPAQIVIVGGKYVGAPRSQMDYHYVWNREERQPCKQTIYEWWMRVLAGSKLLIGHNIKFDLQHVWRIPACRAAFRTWFVQGGRVWDTQLAEYLLRGMEQAAQTTALEDLAIAVGGTVKLSEVKTLWNEGVNTGDIDPHLLQIYFCGDGTPDDLGDICNTELVFLDQIKRAVSAGQMASIQMNMGAQVATAEMEMNGLNVCPETAERLLGELRAEVEAAGKDLNKHLPDLPFEFNWGSGQHKSALIFGGTVRYKAVEFLGTNDVWWCPERDGAAADGWEQAYTPKTIKEQTLDADGQPVLYKDGKSAGLPKFHNVKVPDLDKPKKRQCEVEYKFPGYVVPNKKWLRSDGYYSTAADVMEELAGSPVEFIQSLVRMQKLTKDLTTYFLSDDGTKGMLTKVGVDNLIHHALHMVRTITARLSSSDPNMQNVPRKGTSKVKQVFTSRFEGGYIVQSDFTSLEIYTQAMLTGCKNLILDLLAGLDMHCRRVSQTHGISYEDAVRLCKVEEVPEWKNKRTDAKGFSFQRAYGAGLKKISESTGIPYDVVEAMAKAEAENYPELEGFFTNELIPAVEASLIPAKQWIPHPDFPKLIINLGTGYFRTPDGKLYSFKQSPSPDYLVKKGVHSSFSPTEMKNYCVQGLGAEFAKCAIYLAVWLFWKYERQLAGRAVLINQVHDAAYADAAADVAVTAAAMLEAAMQEANALFEYLFKWEVPAPVPTETTYGSSMAEEKHIDDPDFSAKVLAFRNVIRDGLMPGFSPSFDMTESMQ